MVNDNPVYEDLSKDTPIKKKLLSRIKNTFPDLEEKEATSLLRDIKRFVNLAQKVRTEPQLQVSYKKRKAMRKYKELLIPTLRNLQKS